MDARLDLQPHQLAIVQNILRQYIPDLRVFVVGSRVRGFAKPYSDLDLLIDNSEPLPSKILSVLRDEFGESNLPWRVDLVEMVRLSPTYFDTMKKIMVQIQPEV